MRKLMMLAVALAAAMPLMAETETLGGKTVTSIGSYVFAYGAGTACVWCRHSIRTV